MPQNAYFQTTPLTWWQKALAVLGLCVSIALAAVVGVIILYALLVLIAAAVIIGVIIYARFRFFPPKRHSSKAKRGPDGITIVETSDGVVIDVPSQQSGVDRES